MVNRSLAHELTRVSLPMEAGADAGAVVSIHQPNYIPWLGYFFKIAYADKLVFMDMVMLPNRGFVNRNYIKTQNGASWLTIPVLRKGRCGQFINEARTANLHRWAHRHSAALRNNYSKAPYFNEIVALLQPHYDGVSGDASSLADFNIGLIRAIAAYLKLNTQFVRASDLRVSGQKTDLLRNICLALGATTYLAGSGARSYQEDSKLAEAGIHPVYSPFSSPTYPQLFRGFIPNLSIVDVVMNCGARGTRRLLGIEAERSDRLSQNSAA